MAKKWRLRPHDATRVERLEQTAKLPSVVAQLLVGRGIYEAEDARSFIDAKLAGLRLRRHRRDDLRVRDALDEHVPAADAHPHEAPTPPETTTEDARPL